MNFNVNALLDEQINAVLEYIVLRLVADYSYCIRLLHLFIYFMHLIYSVHVLFNNLHKVKAKEDADEFKNLEKLNKLFTIP